MEIKESKEVKEEPVVKKPHHDFKRRLFAAAEDGNYAIVYRILKAKVVDVDIRDYAHNTPLMKAVKAGHFTVVQLLIENGADVNSFNSLLVTPLHIAAACNHSDITKLLLVARAKFSSKNKDGFIPIDYTKYNTVCWEVLTEAAYGDLPHIDEISEVPVIPDFALEAGTGVKPKKGKKKGKKGKKGKGKGKKGKKGGKKKGKKKKKK